jgi:hypothetical protein
MNNTPSFRGDQRSGYVPAPRPREEDATTEQGQLALALAHLKLCTRDLTSASDNVIEASIRLSGARHSRAVELYTLVGDAIAFAERMAFVVEGDLRAEQ